MRKTGRGILAISTILCLGAAIQAQYGRPPGSRPGGGWNYGGNPGNWDSSWDQRPNPGRGACFYTDAGFRGHHFCLNAGDRIPRLPGNLGDSISSIQTFGRAQARVFEHNDFQGINASFRNSVPDLSRVGTRRGENWNDRISSVAVQ